MSSTRQTGNSGSARKNTNTGGNFPETIGTQFQLTNGDFEAQNIQVTEFAASWSDGVQSVEHEFALQKHQADLVYNYWKSNGGRDAATRFDKYHVFAILDHKSVAQKRKTRAQKYMYKTHWMGHEEEESTWEPGVKVIIMAAQIKKRYDDENGL
ncbi:hypothetical protein FBEOM_10712 [Fusarium beomiforme]|uniref:Chromo domain-containing protein n=1 Tax=Fusarium beomiforme TaxID=44412 RepID=A0A9P5AAY4_9HYPO|nr:hypothetical protein FBEOM_10712 [Fusarium beomiforme]